MRRRLLLLLVAIACLGFDVDGSFQVSGSISTGSISVADVTPPADPTTVAASPGSTSISVSWDAPGEGDYSYSEVEYEADPASWPGTALSPDPTSSPASITGLTAETAYDIRVRHCDTSDNCSSWVETTATTTAVSSFVTMAESSLASDPTQLDLPNVYPGSPVDTSTWVQHDVTLVGGTNPAASGPNDADFSACGNLDNTGATDVSANLACMIQGVGDFGLLYFPDGVYSVRSGQDGIAVFRPRSAYDHRGLIFESRSAIIEYDVSHTENVVLLEGEQASGGVGEIYLGSDLGWSGGSRGDTELTLSSVSGLSTTADASGNWIHIYADPTGPQDNSQRSYYTRVTAIDGLNVTIAHPLPEDFGSSGAGVRVWDPAIEWVIRGGTIRSANPNHSNRSFSFGLMLKNMAKSEVSGTRITDIYKGHMIIEWTADLYLTGLLLDNWTWDKATNGYSIQMANSVRPHIHDNLFEALTGIAFSNGTQEALVTYNDFNGPHNVSPFTDPFDVGCNDLGDGSTCDTEGINAEHRTAHGPTQTFACTDANTDGFCDLRTGFQGNHMHCEDGENDFLGLSGDASCRGVGSTAVYSCVEFHDRTASNTTFMRNQCAGSIWMDWTFGGGRRNFYFGNHMKKAGFPEYDTSPGDAGDWYTRDLGGGGDFPTTYENNNLWVNMLFEGQFGGGMGYDVFGNGVEVRDTVIGDDCLDAQASGEDVDSGACTNIGNPTPGYEAVNGVWSNNTVGALTHGGGYARTMPSLPGLDDWLSFAITPTTRSAPYVGPELGDPTTLTGCLPAREREYGVDCTR